MKPIELLLFFVLLLSIIHGEETMKESEKATFGAGCFWCVEAVFEGIIGVIDVRSGYTGGNIENPTYEQICTGETGHAEVIQMDFDKTIISFSELLETFWISHDPTTLNRQGADSGTQYRSAIFYHNNEQKLIAEKSKQSVEISKVFPQPIVTDISPLSIFYLAENYHQDYFRNNPKAPYCQMVIKPKLDKLKIHTLYNKDD